MLLTSKYALLPALLTSLAQQVSCAEVHGASEAGKMGPVAFLWPADREWSAAADNTAPCGSSVGVTNRTNFPLGTGGIELSIADESYDIRVSVAFSNDPLSQNDFTAQVSGVAEVDPGHQCYKLPNIPASTKENTNATIQLQYSSVDSGKNETFYACADITFVSAQLILETIPCFNVSSKDFVAVTASSSAVPSATPSASSSLTPVAVASQTAAPSSSGVASAVSNNELTTAAKAGIAVGSIVGGLLILGAVAFVLRRRSKARNAASQLPMTEKALSMSSGDSARMARS